MKIAGTVVFALLLALLFVMKLKPEWITRHFVDEPSPKVDVAKLKPMPAPQPAQPSTLTPLDRSKSGQPAQPLRPLDPAVLQPK